MDHKKHEVLALSILIITLLIFFSLVSFRSTDLTLFSSSAVRRPPQNWVGFPGANLAWCLFFLFGLGSFGLPLTGLWLSWSLFRGTSPLPYGRIQIFGIVLLILSAISLATLHHSRVNFLNEEILTGGWIGLMVAGFLSSNFYSVGAHILLTGILLIALVLATPFSLKAACTWVAHSAHSGFRSFFSLILQGFSRLHLPSRSLPEMIAPVTGRSGYPKKSLNEQEPPRSMQPMPPSRYT